MYFCALWTGVATVNAWDQIKQYLEAKVSLDAYRNWIQRTGLLTQDGTTLRVAVPDDVTKDWLEQEYAADIVSAIRTLSLPVQSVVYETGQSNHRPPSSDSAKNTSGFPLTALPSQTTKIDPVSPTAIHRPCVHPHPRGFERRLPQPRQPPKE